MTTPGISSRTCRAVTGFIGGTSRPSRLRLSEKPKPMQIMQQVQDTAAVKPTAEIFVFAPGEAGAGDRWPVSGFQRHGRGRQFRKEQAQGVGIHFRPVDAGGVELQPGGKGLTNPIDVIPTFYQPAISGSLAAIAPDGELHRWQRK